MGRINWYLDVWTGVRQWTLPTPEKFKQTYSEFYTFIVDRTKNPWMPTELPDGNYKYGFPQQSICAPVRDVSPCGVCPYKFSPKKEFYDSIHKENSTCLAALTK